MFVEQESLGAIQKLHFFNNKSLPKGNKSERLVSQFLELSCNPKGKLAYKTFFDMQEEKQFVIGNAVRVTITPTQKRILDFINMVGIEKLSQDLLELQELATYHLDEDVEPNLTASYTLLLLHKSLTQKN